MAPPQEARGAMVLGAVGLQTYIWNNNLRSGFLLAGFPVLLALVFFAAELMLFGNAALGMFWQSLPLSILVALVWFAIAWFANQAIIDLATGARKIERRDDPELYNLLENLCISRGLATPTLRIVDSDALNAFASGLKEGRFSVTVTRGLRETMDRDELEAVLGHELTHIINRDVRTMVIAAVFAGIITLICEMMFRAMWWGGSSLGGRRDRRGGGGLFVIVALGIAAVGYMLAIVVRMAISRSREFVADMGSVQLTRNPDAMISALRKIEGHSKLEAPDMVQGMFMDSDDGFMGLFATHPPIAKRIAALQQYAGGRDAGPPESLAPAVPVTAPDPPRTGPWS